MYDLIIVGGGPAGITAGIYAVRKRMKLLMVARDIGGQTNWTRHVENYTGYQLISGQELVKRFRDHLAQFDVAVHEGESAKSITRHGAAVRLVTDKGEYESRSLIIASGMTHRLLNVPGESRLVGRGLAYCATCDAPLFAEMDVAVIGGGNSSLDAAMQLIQIARKVHIIDRSAEFSADKIMVERVLASPKVTVWRGAGVTEVLGDNFVNGIKIEQDGRETVVPVEGVFVEIGWQPASSFAAEVEKNECGEIVVNCSCETSVRGIFAAGDVTSIPAKQIIVACGEGAKATLSAFKYVSSRYTEDMPLNR